jgi:ABC-type transport system involved in multi-copper enzyme maturation permease subunit
MLTIISKEARELLYSSKFVLIFFAGLILILIAVFNGYATYSLQGRLVDKGAVNAIEDAKDHNNYPELGNSGLKVYRRPDKLSIFNTGLNNVVGYKAVVTDSGSPQIKEGRFYASPVLSIFGELDLCFVVSFIFPLFAILFSYNAIAGEKESGTLRLIMANQVSRISIAAGKALGGFLPVIITFILPFGIGLVGLIFLGGIEFSSDDLIGAGIIALVSLLYLLVFHLIGLMVSALTKRSFLSLLVCLFIWVFFTSIVPRLAVQVSANSIETASPDEIEQNIASFKRSERAMWGRYMKEYFEENPTRFSEYMTKTGDATNYVRWKTAQKTRDYEDSVLDEWERKQRQVAGTAVFFSRISPMSCYSFALHRITGSGIEMVEAFRKSLRIYRNRFIDYLKKENKPEDLSMFKLNTLLGIKSFGMNSSGYVEIQVIDNYQPPRLDLSSLPKYTGIGEAGAGESLDYVIDINMLLVYAVVLFMGIIIAFALYDVR